MDVHILFGGSATGSLKVALRESGIISQDEVITFLDIFSIGPVWQLHDESGINSRSEWLKKHIHHDYFNDIFNNEYDEAFQDALRKITTIPEQEMIKIWIGNNAHDQTGLRFLLYLLQGKNNEIYVVNVTEAYKERFKSFTPRHLGEITTDKLAILIKNHILFQP